MILSAGLDKVNYYKMKSYLLYKVYLSQLSFSNASKWAKEIIDTNKYSLFSDYARLFRKEGENGVESLFEIQATALEATWAGAMLFNIVQGVGKSKFRLGIQ